MVKCSPILSGVYALLCIPYHFNYKLISLSLTGDWFHWREPGGPDADKVTIFYIAEEAQAFTVY